MSNSPYQYQPSPSGISHNKGGGSSTLKIVLITLGVVCFLCCGGAVSIFFVGWGALNQGLTTVAEHAVSASPETSEAVGKVKSAKLNFSESNNKGGDRTAVVDVEGTNGNAKVIIFSDKHTGEVVLPDGRRFPVTFSENE